MSWLELGLTVALVLSGGLNYVWYQETRKTKRLSEVIEWARHRLYSCYQNEFEHRLKGRYE